MNTIFVYSLQEMNDFYAEIKKLGQCAQNMNNFKLVLCISSFCFLLDDDQLLMLRSVADCFPQVW